MLLGDTEHRLCSPDFEDNTFMSPDLIYRDAQTVFKFYCVCQCTYIIYFFKNSPV